jgi:hypothetical protein
MTHGRGIDFQANFGSWGRFPGKFTLMSAVARLPGGVKETQVQPGHADCNRW